MLCEKNRKILDDEIERLERRALTWESCDKLCMLYRLREHMEDSHTDAHVVHITRETAEAWVSGLQRDDPAYPNGGKWTMDQVKPVAQKYGVPTDGEKFFEFWAVMNALYADYYGVAKKYNVLSADFFADLTMAFLHDLDAVDGKAGAYYRHIAKK